MLTGRRGGPDLQVTRRGGGGGTALLHRADESQPARNAATIHGYIFF